MIKARIGKNPKVLMVFDNAMSPSWLTDGVVTRSGILPLLKKYIDAGVPFDDVSAVCLADTTEKPKSSDYKAKAEYVDELIQTYNFNLIITIGAAAFEKIVGMKGAAKYFGKILLSEKYEGQKVLACPNPAQAKHDPGIMNVIATCVELAASEMEFAEIMEADKLPTHYQIIDTPEKFEGFIQYFLGWQVPEFAYDLETTGLNFNIDEITTIQFSHKPGYSYLIPCNTIGNYPAAPCPWTDEQWEYVKQRLTCLFTDENKTVIGHNKKFDDKFLYHHWGVPLQKGRSFDTMIASFLCDENTPNGLKELTCQLTDMGDYELPLEKFKTEYCKQHKILKVPSKKNPAKLVFSYGMIPFEILAPYALADTDATIRLYHHFKEELVKEEQVETMRLVMRITWLLTRFELNGWPVDVEYGLQLRVRLEEEIAELEAKLAEHPSVKRAEEVIRRTKLQKENGKKDTAAKAKIEALTRELSAIPVPAEGIDPKMKKKIEKQRETLAARIAKYQEKLVNPLSETKDAVKFNLGSTDQKRILFFDVLKLPVVKKTKKKQPAVDKEAVSIWMRTVPAHRDLLMDLQHYAELCKFLSTYVIGILSKTVNGRVHPTFNPIGAKTGRTSSREPNFQNLPARGDDRKMKLVKAIKRMIKAPEGHLMLGADLSAIEMAWACIVSGDKKLEEIFINGIDIHGAVAKELFDYIECHPNEVKKLYEFERNSVSKTVQFLSVYGGGADALAKKVNESIIERQEMAKAKGQVLELKEYTIEDAQKILDDYFHKYQGVAQYIKDTTLHVMQKGYAVSAFGYRRRVPAVNSSDEGVVAQAVRQAVNATIQNPASVSLLLAICNLQEEIDEKGLNILLMGSCHDAAYCQVVEEDIITARDLLLHYMTQPPLPNCPIPIRAEAEYGKDWASFTTDFGTALVDLEDEEDLEDEDETGLDEAA